MGMPQRKWDSNEVMTKVPKGMVLLTREHYEELAAAREREIDEICLKAVERIEARKAAGNVKYYTEEEVNKRFEEKYGYKRIRNSI